MLAKQKNVGVKSLKASGYELANFGYSSGKEGKYHQKKKIKKFALLEMQRILIKYDFVDVVFKSFFYPMRWPIL